MSASVGDGFVTSEERPTSPLFVINYVCGSLCIFFYKQTQLKCITDNAHQKVFSEALVRHCLTTLKMEPWLNHKVRMRPYCEDVLLGMRFNYGRKRAPTVITCSMVVLPKQRIL